MRRATDTFWAGARKIRVLGIDSCESSTQGGPAATAEATALLLGHPGRFTSWVHWFDTSRLHTGIDNIPPVEYE